MVAMVCCVVCWQLVTANNYRTLRSLTSEIIPTLQQFRPSFQEYPDSHSSICRVCLTKLTKYNTLDKKIRKQIDFLKQAQEEIWSYVTTATNATDVICPLELGSPKQTPVKDGKRQIASPGLGLKKSKPDEYRRPIKKSLFTSNCENSATLAQHLNHDVVKVEVNYKSGAKQQAVVGIQYEAALKSIAHKRETYTIVKNIWAEKELRDNIIKLFLSSLKKELKVLCGLNDPSYLRQCTPDDLLNFQWQDLMKEWFEKAPLFYQVLEACCLTGNSQLDMSSHYPALGYSGSILIFHRNNHMARVMHCTGLLLDRGGATDETISLLNQMGICVSPSSVYNKKKELLNKQKELMTQNVEKVVNKIEEKKCLQNIINYKAPRLTHSTSTISSTKIATSSPILTDKSNIFQYQGHFAESPVKSNLAVNIPSREFSLANSSTTQITDSCSKMTGFNSQNKTLAELQIGPIMLPTVDLSFNTMFNMQGNIDHCAVDRLRAKASLIDDTKRFEVLGDNVDIFVKPTMMTSSKSTKDYHFFLVLMKEIAVTANLPDETPKADILNIPADEFLPNDEDNKLLYQHMIFHVAHCLASYVECLKPFKESLPEHIIHPYMKETSKKSNFLNCDLINESEGTSDGCIRIMQYIMDTFIPHTRTSQPLVTERVTMEGDVLTCNIAECAQEAMLNSSSDFDGLQGFNLRPGGLHRVMNLVQVHNYII